MPKYVVSQTLTDPHWGDTTVISGDIARSVASLRDRFEGHILVNGRIELVRTLLIEGLVDELRLMVFPTLLGAGKRLYGEEIPSTTLRLIEWRPAGETFILTYQLAAVRLAPTAEE